jgi:hypothetical protein
MNIYGWSILASAALYFGGMFVVYEWKLLLDEAEND